MAKMSRRSLAATFGAAVLAGSLIAGVAGADENATHAEIDVMANFALDSLYAQNKGAAELAKSAAGVLVFPKITKAGFGIGGEAGKGVLRINGASAAYYRTRSVSFGVQAGVQTYGYAILFLTQNALDDFRAKKGFEVGVDGSVAVLDEGATVDIDTTNLKAEAVGIVFNEQGLMANFTVEGSKITQID